jgi:hypothetical protein
VNLADAEHDKRTANWPTYYGIKLVDAGEDGDVVILGHPDRRRAVAALNCHARKFWGTSLVGGYADTADDLTPRWARFLTECESESHKFLIECEGKCWKCEEIKSSDWYITWNADPLDKDAFPILHWGP